MVGVKREKEKDETMGKAGMGRERGCDKRKARIGDGGEKGGEKREKLEWNGTGNVINERRG